MDYKKHRKPTIKNLVNSHAEYLKEAKTHAELRSFAERKNLDNARAFGLFKKHLLEIGVDYNSLRSKALEGKQNNIRQKATKQITLFCDAKARAERFCICNSKGEAVWHGKFYKYVLEQSKGELEAAKKAIWLAKKVAEINNLEGIKLKLFVDAEWLTWANCIKEGETKKGGKARHLGIMAQEYNIDLQITWMEGRKNPADYHTTGLGWLAWQEGIKKIELEPVNNE